MPKGVIPGAGVGPGPRETAWMALLALLAFGLPLAGWGLWRLRRGSD